MEDHHKRAASLIVSKIIDDIQNSPGRYTITVAGESGSGKSETGKAIADELEKYGIRAVVLGQDDYFVLPPKTNDAKRREDPDWLGPHVEVKMNVLDKNLQDALLGKNLIVKPLIDYNNNTIEDETIDLSGVRVIIAEGTYTSLLKNVRTRIFIQRSRLDTLSHRKKRNRGNEADDDFIERILITEHKIIAGHRQLADFLVTNNFDVVPVREIL